MTEILKTWITQVCITIKIYLTSLLHTSLLQQMQMKKIVIPVMTTQLPVMIFLFKITIPEMVILHTASLTLTPHFINP